MTTQNQSYEVTVSTTHSDPVLISSVTKYNFSNGVAFLQDVDGDIFIYPVHTIKDIYMSEQTYKLTECEGVDTSPSL